MTALFTSLQAAMGLGVLLYEFAKIILFVVFPLVWIITSIQTIRKDKNKGFELDWKDYAYALMRGFVFGFLTLLIILVVVILLIYFFVDLSIS